MITFVYKATITNIVDGDTVDAIVDLGFNVQTKIRFRLNGIDTPEMNQKNEAIREIAKSAKEFLIKHILDKHVCILQTKTDKYGRWLADISIDPNSPTVNEQLIALNLAKRYQGENKTNLWE